jgi:hypothetical protein
MLFEMILRRQLEEGFQRHKKVCLADKIFTAVRFFNEQNEDDKKRKIRS